MRPDQEDDTPAAWGCFLVVVGGLLAYAALCLACAIGYLR